MTFANAMSLATFFLLYSGVVLNRKHDLYFGIVSFILISLLGSRGGFMSVGIYCVILFLYSAKSTKKAFISMAAVFLVLLITLFWNEILSAFAYLLSRFGFNSRTILMISQSKMLISNDRLSIYTYLVDIILRNKWTGIGLCGDRYYLPFAFKEIDSVYAHNIVIELLADYGLIIGVAILLYIVLLFCTKLFFHRHINYKKRMFYFAFFSCFFLQLMVSRSYLNEPGIYAFIAMLVNERKEMRINGQRDYSNLQE